MPRYVGLAADSTLTIREDSHCVPGTAYMSTALQRITTEYVEHEDRLRITGELAGGETKVLWLTQRLMNRLVAHLCQPLERPASDARSASIQRTFEQQAAAAALTPQPPVQPSADVPQALVQSVDLTVSPSAVTLVFKDEAGDVLAQLTLAPLLLRQWLSVVHGQYQKGEWSTGAWPLWLEEAQAVPSAAAATVWH
ncbi:hypothetical protein [Stutzerimonas balearica]|uniref:hypothetical protein n=1 Tax=Stutzerimonas balearica TaxID=74829 RepID=UPI0011AEFF9D|nr:hypothetical protein [Stutzerimonas balearica]